MVDQYAAGQAPQQYPTGKSSLALLREYLSQQNNVPQVSFHPTGSNTGDIAQGLTNMFSGLAQNRANRQQQQTLAYILQQQAAAEQSARAEQLANLTEVSKQTGVPLSILMSNLDASVQNKLIEPALAQQDFARKKLTYMQTHPGATDEEAAYAVTNFGADTGAGIGVKGDFGRQNVVNDITYLNKVGADPTTYQGQVLMRALLPGVNVDPYTFKSNQEHAKQDAIKTQVDEKTFPAQVNKPFLDNSQTEAQTADTIAGTTTKNINNATLADMNLADLTQKRQNVDKGQWQWDNQKQAISLFDAAMHDPNVYNNPGAMAVLGAHLNMLNGGQNPVGVLQGLQSGYIGGKPAARNPEQFKKFNEMYPAGGFQQPSTPTPQAKPGPVSQPATHFQVPDLRPTYKGGTVGLTTPGASLDANTSHVDYMAPIYNWLNNNTNLFKPYVPSPLDRGY